MCRIQLTEYTPSLGLARPITVNVDPTRLAHMLTTKLTDTLDVDGPDRDRYYAILGCAIADAATPACPAGSEYVVDEPLETLALVLADA